MISEFELLANKVDSLAELAHALRIENAELRRSSAQLLAENADMHQRMSQAHERVAALLGKMPGDESSDKENA
jgi:cell division protein ZapB